MTVKSILGACNSCGLVTKLHLVVRKNTKGDLIDLFCPECMTKHGIGAGPAVIEIEDTQQPAASLAVEDKLPLIIYT